MVRAESLIQDEIYMVYSKRSVTVTDPLYVLLAISRPEKVDFIQLKKTNRGREQDEARRSSP